MVMSSTVEGKQSGTGFVRGCSVFCSHVTSEDCRHWFLQCKSLCRENVDVLKFKRQIDKKLRKTENRLHIKRQVIVRRSFHTRRPVIPGGHRRCLNL